MNSDIWINGVHLGVRPYGYSSFQYELTPHLKLGDRRNVLAVRVNVQQPCSRWYSGAGIYRTVRLVITDPVHIGHWGTSVATPHVSQEEATVRVTTTIQNDSADAASTTLETTLVDPQGRKVATSHSRRRLDAESSGAFEQLLAVRKPMLWCLESPSLYRVRSSVSVNGDLVDVTERPFGIRTIEFTNDKGFLLNGRHVDVQGVCLHHDLGCLGAAVRTRAIERQLQIMKSMGANAIRTSHNPPAPELLDLCDRMGFLVMDEAFDEWKRSKTMFGYGRFFDEWSERDLADMIRRDRNHPSIIMWSTGNEIPEQDNANAYEMSKRLVDIAHALDPTRPVTAGCNIPEAAVRTGFAKPLDVLGINYAMPFYETAKGTAKLVASETTSAVSTRGEYNLVIDGEGLKVEAQLDNQCSSYNDTTAATTIEALRNAPWVAGQFAWTGFDYIGEPSPFSWPSVGSYFGIVDRCGFPKDRYYLYQSQWTDEPVVHILPHWNWQGFEGREIPVWCYSNADSVELFLNDKSLGEKTTQDAEDLRLEWKVPYAPGALRAVARRDGMTVATDEIHTAGRPARIVLKPDRTELSADGEDLSYVRVEVVDRAGHLCPNADNPVRFAIEGEGVIAGVDNGNPISHEHFKASERKAFHGLCLAVIQVSGTAGTIRLSARSDGLEGAVVTLETKESPAETGLP
jgi:beta-galactosidase